MKTQLSEKTFIAVDNRQLTRASCDQDGEWSVTTFLSDQKASCLAADPTNKDVIYAGANGKGCFRSQDRGRSWSPLGLEGQIVKSLAVSPHDPGVIYAGLKPASVAISRDGGQTWVLKHGLPEFPNPLTSCPGYQRPVGPPILLQIGPGDQVPVVTDHSFSQDGQELEHCVFDETSYVNPDNQDTGRHLLDSRDAVVLMPRKPLEVGKAYTVRIVVNGQTVSWTFTAVGSPW